MNQMKSRLAALLKKRFAVELCAQIPSFVSVEEQTGPSRWQHFQWKVADSLIFSVILVIPESKKGDRFTVEIGWNTTTSFPGELGPSSDPSESGLKGVRFRISKLWSKREKWWWLGPEETLETALKKLNDEQYLKPEDIEPKMIAIEPTVTDAVAMIKRYGLPYFKSIAERQGIVMPPQIGRVRR